MVKHALRAGRDVFGREGIFVRILDKGSPYPTPTDPLCLLKCAIQHPLWLQLRGDDIWECTGCKLKLSIPADDPSMPAHILRDMQRADRKWRIISRMHALCHWLKKRIPYMRL